MTLSEIIAALPKLKQDELKAVKAVAERLLASSSHISGYEQELFLTLCDKLSARVSWTQFRAGAAGRPWAKGAATVLCFAEGSLHLGQWSKAPRMAIFGLLLGLVIDDLKGRKAPVTLGTVTANLSRVPMLFEEAYPGYLEGGMAMLVLEKLTGGGK